MNSSKNPALASAPRQQAVSLSRLSGPVIGAARRASPAPLPAFVHQLKRLTAA